MDGKVKDFFNEIEAMVPTKETNSEWQVCYDERSGCSYYWNVKTDKVTWDVPAGYNLLKSHGAENNLTNVQPRPAPLFSSRVPSPPKIFKTLQDSHKPSSAQSKSSFLTDDIGEKRRVSMTSYKSNSSSGDEEKDLRTITIVKAEQPLTIPGSCLPTKDVQQTFLPPNSFPSSDSDSNSDREEDIDLLTKIQNRAKVLTQLGGKIPASVKKIVEHNGYNESVHEKITKQSRRDVTGFSLVAGYSDSDEDEVAPLPIRKSENKTVVSSALFPISKPVDVNQFNEIKNDSASTSEHVDAKAFQRKRRIGIDYMNSITRPKPEKIKKTDDERLGLGFRSEKENESEKNEMKINYTGFKSGGLMFSKSDVNSVTEEQEKKIVPVNLKQISDKNKKYTADDVKKIEDAHKSVNEKLHFLAEGHTAVSPVQTMIIQMETLYDAMKDKSLSIDYLYKWLQDTFTELGKLEKGVAPPGWILKWDRIVKRYYYRNQHSGDCQWEYPQPDVVTADEAMDISTTPPPPVVDEPPLPPLPPPLPPGEPIMLASFSDQPPPPPRIRSPTPPPPPPPTISKEDKQKQKVKVHVKHPHVSGKKHLAPPEDVYQNLGEPLPPGVDLPQFEIQPVAMVNSETNDDVLGSALNSFYSDLATLEANLPTVSVPTASVPTVSVPTPIAVPLYMIAPAIQNPVILNNVPVEKPIKKKKSKVKLVEGLAMKRKGVSKLVEKWKSVQKDY